ncbi:MAG: RluA family pseudouridine synthase [Hyphomicrobiales bacterium]|nr:RluA family pseudouridine synthase [Hyphomicrobiales bacterium]
MRKGGKPPAKGGARGAPPGSGGRDRRGRGEDREARKEAGRKTAAGRAAVARSSRPEQRDEPRRMAKPTGYRPREDRPTARAARVVEGGFDPQHLRDAPEAPVRTKREAKAEASETIATGVQTLVVTDDEAGMRVDRFLIARFPQLPFSHIQRIARKGELRVDMKRVDTNDRVEAGQKVRVPPLKLSADGQRPRGQQHKEGDVRAFLKSITLYEDADVLVIGKPAGLAVQGGSGTTRHVDGMLMALAEDEVTRPRLVHRLDKDTAGCLVIAKTRFAASTLAKTFRSRSARKIYWALVYLVPRVKQGRISTYLAREAQVDGDSRMKVAAHGDEGAQHAVTYYATVDTAAQKLAWLSLKPVTGRTHQLRAHAAHIGHPIIGDPKYFDRHNAEIPGGIQNRLHLLARRIVLPHPRGQGVIDVTAPLPDHMKQSWNLLGFDTSPYDPIVEAPDE